MLLCHLDRFVGLDVIAFSSLSHMLANAHHLGLQLPPIPHTSTGYSGPDLGDNDPCACSSVYYSTLSACSYCQIESFLRCITTLSQSFLRLTWRLVGIDIFTTAHLLTFTTKREFYYLRLEISSSDIIVTAAFLTAFQLA